MKIGLSTSRERKEDSARSILWGLITATLFAVTEATIRCTRLSDPGAAAILIGAVTFYATSAWRTHGLQCVSRRDKRLCSSRQSRDQADLSRLVVLVFSNAPLSGEHVLPGYVSIDAYKAETITRKTKPLERRYNAWQKLFSRFDRLKMLYYTTFMKKTVNVSNWPKNGIGKVSQFVAGLAFSTSKNT